MPKTITTDPSTWPVPATRSEAIALMCELRDLGVAWGPVRSHTGLNHVVAEREYMRHQFIVGGGEVLPATPENARALRDDQQLSWGQITVRLGLTGETAARNLYKQGTGVLSEGQRIGKGGRWLGNDQELYRDELNPTGTRIDVKAGRMNARVLAAQQRIAKMDTAKLRQFAQDNGVNPKGKTPAQIAKALYKVLGIDKLEAKGQKANGAAA